MSAKKAYIFSNDYFEFDYGPQHPLRIERLKLADHLIRAYGLLDIPGLIIEQTIPAQQKQIETFHRIDYLDVLKKCSREGECIEEAYSYGMGPGDNPVFKGMWSWSLLTAGASIQAGKMVAEGLVDTAFNMAGGLHHAMAGKASGFCYVNDIVILIKDLLAGGRRVAYVDIDAHHGDGVQSAFYDNDQVLTVSIHQHGKSLFPGTGFVYETGAGKGQGFAVNIPVYPGTDDEVFVSVFNSIVPDLIEAFEPDVMVTQLGVDTMRTDPLTNLCLTNNGFVSVMNTLKKLNKPWVALGGGGYHVVNVARAWTLAWAVINGLEPPDELPESFLDIIRPYGYRETKLRDEHYWSEDGRKKEAVTVAGQIVDTLKETVLPALSRSRKIK